MIAVLGAGPHGQELADLYPAAILFDDNIAGYEWVITGAMRYPYIIGAFWPKVRRHIHDKVRGEPYKDGTVVFPQAIVSQRARLGEHVHVLYGAVVSHGCNVGDFVTIASNATLCGEVTVESGAVIGAGAVVRHGGITIGRNAVVGMGAVVVDDVPDNTKVVGNPAKVLVTL